MEPIRGHRLVRGPRCDDYGAVGCLNLNPFVPHWQARAQTLSANARLKRAYGPCGIGPNKSPVPAP